MGDRRVGGFLAYFIRVVLVYRPRRGPGRRASTKGTSRAGVRWGSRLLTNAPGVRLGGICTWKRLGVKCSQCAVLIAEQDGMGVRTRTREWER
jgi:hypothetical protein